MAVEVVLGHVVAQSRTVPERQSYAQQRHSVRIKLTDFMCREFGPVGATLPNLLSVFLAASVRGAYRHRADVRRLTIIPHFTQQSCNFSAEAQFRYIAEMVGPQHTRLVD